MLHFGGIIHTFLNYKLQNTMPLSIKKAGAETKLNHKLQITNKDVSFRQFLNAFG
jgi:hypothetical protein